MLIKKGGISRNIDPNSWGAYAEKGYIQAGDCFPAKPWDADKLPPMGAEEAPVVPEVPPAEPESPPPVKFPCPHCGKKYAAEETLSKHVADKHPEV